MPIDIITKAQKIINVLRKVLKDSCASLRIEWAPLHVPLQRRLQTLAACGWICLVLVGELASILLWLRLLYSDYYLLGLAYTFWMMNDIDVCHRGGRSSKWVRSWAWWRYFRDYFPITLVKTADLDPSRNYLLACFPHGVVCTGAFASFMTDALGWDQLFPGMKSHLITLGGHFLVPFFRELILAGGACSSSAESVAHLLDTRRGRGRCAALIVGGAAESLHAQPGRYSLVLTRRKGFVRMAIKSGAPLVPVFSFGEPDVFRPPSNPEHGALRTFQEKVRRLTGIAPMFPLGRGLFQYSFGVLPLRSPITTVVGEPLEVARNLEPTEAEVAAVHAQFTARLLLLFDTHKHKYISNPDHTQLLIS